MTEQELSEIESRCDAATPGPWYARLTDDAFFMNSLYVSTHQGSQQDGSWSLDNKRGLEVGGKHQEPPGQVIAITLLQQPRLADVVDKKWGENTLFIAHAREDIPKLIAEIRQLQKKLRREN
jgi:hypothetical protein